MRLNAKIEVDTPFKDIIYNSLSPDLGSAKKVKIDMLNNDMLEFAFEADDASSLRAGVNMVLQLLKLSGEILED